MSQSSTMYYTRAPIHMLPPDVAERIAAGEVIERPVSVVKELVENALDAGARDIGVEVRGGGLRLIRVTDDGYGIPGDELEQALARHSTSKISAVEDLERLRTLGFRGEALASVAAVSELSLVSRPIETASETTEGFAEVPASMLIARGGEIVERGYRARPRGTTITVRDLFYNVPARLKFMRGARTEASHVLQLMRRCAVGYPAVRFHLVIDEHTALQTSGSGNVATALAELYQLPFDEMLSPISATLAGETTLHGYVGNRVLAQNGRQHIMLFVNGRWVQSRALQDALEAGYRNLLPKGKHPLLVLFLDVPPAEIDVNVHPAKTEVKLARETEIAAALTSAIHAALGNSPTLPQESALPGPRLLYQRRLPGPRRRGLHVSESSEAYKAESALPETPVVLAQLRPLAQLQQAVILAEAPDGSLYLIDQHRAHERVIYEHLRNKHSGLRERGEEVMGEAHLLLEPVIVEMKRHQAELLEQRLPMLRDLGLECERFGGRSFLIRSVPGGVGQEQLAGHVRELAELASEDSADWEDHLLIGIACRSALRRGRELSQGEQVTLIAALAQASAPAVCPHGSPILLHYSRSFLVNRFDW
jgi:DNA mismatch repair protein MutL